MTLSITNHPPYRLPKDVEIQKIKLDEKTLDRFPYDNTETIFATFRYANDELGKFINAVKEDVSLKIISLLQLQAITIWEVLAILTTQRS